VSGQTGRAGATLSRIAPEFNCDSVKKSVKNRPDSPKNCRTVKFQIHCGPDKSGCQSPHLHTSLLIEIDVN
jgi:hypothetical protein